MTRIDLSASTDGDRTDGTDEAAAGELVALVVAVVELLVDVLQREAVRRMERGDLTDDEVERLGRQLATLEAEVDRLKDREGVGDQVDQLRGRLDGLVDGAIRQVDDRDSPRAGGDRL